MRQRGQSEGTGARRDTAEDGNSKREEESQRRETEKNTNDHMKRTSHEARESNFATQKAAVLSLSPTSIIY